MKYLLTVFLLFANLAAFAQGCFKVYEAGREVTVLCVGKTVRFKDCTGQVNPEHEYYFINEEDRNNPNKDTSKVFTPSTPGTFQITQFVNMQGNRYFFTQTFEVKESPEPAFQASICADRTVRITLTDNSYDTYQVDFGNGHTEAIAPDQPLKYRYSADGPYQLTVTGSFAEGSCTNSSSLTLQDIPALQPPFISELLTERQGTADGSLRVTLEQVVPGYSYLLEQVQLPGSSVLSTDTISGIRQPGRHTFSIENINTAEAACYRIRVRDVCGNTSLSNTLCTIVLQATPGDKEAGIAWSTIQVPQQRLELFRGTTRILSPQTQQGSHTDTSLKCGQAYCYSMRSLSASGTAIAISATQCVGVTSTSAPPAGRLLSTYNNVNEVMLTFEAPQGQTFKQLSVQRQGTGNSWQTLGTSGNAFFTDLPGKPAAYCYQVTYTDSCSMVSAVSNITCPMLLALRQQSEAGIVLQWSAYSGFRDGALQYEVELLDPDYIVTGSFPVSGTSFTQQNLPDEQQLRYRVKASSRDGSYYSYSNILEVEQSVKLFVPSGFTPNNDGLNDIFTVKGKFFQHFSIRIYNRSGQVVYQSASATEGWDGTYKGQQQPAGVYVYEIEVTAADGEKKNRKGTVTLIR
ncbi:T9SS type B sorting domain-containing protein [Pontibacter beigongshangensis]|uniref:T9SS type B sorting domain-containing protein n=1 Tax=Pontibacter beigongshangensis TaxID=2574733 RepID=UPI00164FF77B|nr:gliding motility-associated C-terminal domain-containing protein [Pontibacter beigongshangensis]